MKVKQFRARGRAADQRRQDIYGPTTSATVHMGAYFAWQRLTGIGFIDLHGWRIQHHSPGCVSLTHTAAPEGRRLLIFGTQHGDPYFMHDGAAYTVDDDTFTLILCRLGILHYTEPEKEQRS